MDGDQTMKLTQKRLKQIIQEELDNIYQEEIYQEDAEETKKALAKAPDMAQSIADEVYAKCEEVSETSGGAIGASALAGMVADFLAGMKA